MGIVAAYLLGASGFTFVAQEPPSLEEFLKRDNKDTSLVVGAESARASKEGTGLARYGRKTVRVGGLSAIVPTEMVRFEENPTLPPNLYEGLPRSVKIRYLMSTLDPDQWRVAVGQGIGLSDLRGEQRAVFLSILPRHPSWTEVRVDRDHGWGPIVGKGSLDEKATPGMRLRIEQSLQFDLRFQGGKGSTAASPSSELGNPNETVAVLDGREDEESTTTYGVVMRALVPNVLKKGELDTTGLNDVASIPRRTTVGEALRVLSSATGKRILADARVRDLSVAFLPGKARAGDLLDALGLSVAGTYRKVEGVYLLVADVPGAGSRKLRQVLWKEAADAEVERRKAVWTHQAALSGQALSAEFPDDPLRGLTPGLRREVGAWTRDPDSTQYISADELSPEQRGFIEREAARTKDFEIDRSRVHVQASLRYRFVLPDGPVLQPQGSLGSSFHVRAAIRPEPCPGSSGAPRRDSGGRGSPHRGAPRPRERRASRRRDRKSLWLHRTLGGH